MTVATPVAPTETPTITYTLADAIRDGSRLVEPMQGDYVAGLDEDGRWTRACALGMAYLAIR